MKKIGVVGAGAWGTALAQSLANAGHDVLMWAREAEVVESINDHHENKLFLEKIRLNEMIKATHNLHDTEDCDLFFIMTPAQHVRTTLTNFENILTNKPFIGVQIGGSVKNAIAIACGVVDGRKMGESARCALITRGLAEMARLAKAMGANKETLMGMCGVGDLMLTCSSMQSRNFSLGHALGEGKTVEEVLGPRVAVTEGVHTAKALHTMAKNNAIDMPISKAVYDFIMGEIELEDVFEQLLDRPLRLENI